MKTKGQNQKHSSERSLLFILLLFDLVNKDLNHVKAISNTSLHYHHLCFNHLKTV